MKQISIWGKVCDGKDLWNTDVLSGNKTQKEWWKMTVVIIEMMKRGTSGRDWGSRGDEKIRKLISETRWCVNQEALIRRPCKFEVVQPIRCRLRASSLLYVTLRCECDLELWPGDLNLWPLAWTLWPASPRSNSVRNLSEIGQSAAEILKFEYLTFLMTLNMYHVLRYALG